MRCGIRTAGRLGTLLLLACGLVLGMALGASARVTIESVRYSGWEGAYRLTNGTVDLVVVPAVARIMRYGYVGGPNVLWNNPVPAGMPARPGDWPNFGGDKAWPWPQDEWPQYIGHDWPPPEAADQVPFDAEIVGQDTVRISSPLVIGFGLRIVRYITLAPAGTRVTIVTRLEKIRAGGNRPLGAWTITQVPAPETIYACLAPGASGTLPDHWKRLGGDAPPPSVTTEDGILRVRRDTAKSIKVGVDADTLAVAAAGTLFTVRAVVTDPSGYLPGERAQIYATADSSPQDAARGIGPYVELEMTSPKKPLPDPGDTVTLTTVWELRRLPTDASNAVENALRALR